MNYPYVPMEMVWVSLDSAYPLNPLRHRQAF